VLGVDADIASLDFRAGPLRSLSDVDPAAYHLPPRFLERVALHLAKHYLGDAFPARAPLILAVWGPKGCGKSFQVELACKTLGVTPVVLSAGELEDPTAGEPGARLRERYAAAARACAVERTAACLLVNDIDAGIGACDAARVVSAGAGASAGSASGTDATLDHEEGRSFAVGRNLAQAHNILSVFEIKFSDFLQSSGGFLIDRQRMVRDIFFVATLIICPAHGQTRKIRAVGAFHQLDDGGFALTRSTQTVRIRGYRWREARFDRCHNRGGIDGIDIAGRHGGHDKQRRFWGLCHCRISTSGGWNRRSCGHSQIFGVCLQLLARRCRSTRHQHTHHRTHQYTAQPHISLICTHAKPIYILHKTCETHHTAC
jgi:hypothetical protein